MTSTTQRRLAALAMVAVIGAGCSKSPTAGDGNTTTDTRGQAMKFSACMRDNGVQNFPDPDASGELTIDAVVNGTSLDPNTAAFEQAISACKDLEPSGFTGHKRNAQQQAAALQFARCMRDNGVPDFPDPTPDGPLIDTNRIPSLAGKDPRSVLAAPGQKCRDFAAASGVTGGR